MQCICVEDKPQISIPAVAVDTGRPVVVAAVGTDHNLVALAGVAASAVR